MKYISACFHDLRDKLIPKLNCPMMKFLLVLLLKIAASLQYCMYLYGHANEAR